MHQLSTDVNLSMDFLQSASVATKGRGLGLHEAHFEALHVSSF